MKWPNTFTFVRHGESEYNVLKARKNADPLYREFKKAFNKQDKNPAHARELAEAVIAEGKFILGVGEHATGMTTRGIRQAEITGARLKEKIALPDVVLLSPYDRTVQTLAHMAIGWPELKKVECIQDPRLREQDHGLSGLYNDWRLYETMHPEQASLRKLQGAYWYRYLQGENVPDVQLRTNLITDKLIRDYHKKEVLTVGHHLSLLALRANFEDLGADGFVELDTHHKPVNCGVSTWHGRPELGEDGRLVLETYNEQLYTLEEL